MKPLTLVCKLHPGHSSTFIQTDNSDCGGSCQQVTIVCAGMFSNHLIPSQNRVLQIMVVVNGDDDDLISKSHLRNENCGEW